MTWYAVLLDQLWKKTLKKKKKVRNRYPYFNNFRLFNAVFHPKTPQNFDEFWWNFACVMELHQIMSTTRKNLLDEDFQIFSPFFSATHFHQHPKKTTQFFSKKRIEWKFHLKKVSFKKNETSAFQDWILPPISASSS